MTETASRIDTVRSYLVLLATIGMIAFNWLAATGRLNSAETGEISDRYPTIITPAGYAFSIWSVIYAGMIAFSIYQLLPANVPRFRNIRSLYILSCTLNCAWLYFWNGDQIAVCFVLISALCLVLFAISDRLKASQSIGEAAAAKAPFGLYFGWVTAATLVNFAVLLVYLNVDLSANSAVALGVMLILTAAVLAVVVRLKLTNYLYPLAIAWALTAIAVQQSGRTLIVIACAFGVVAALIAALSFVMNLPSSTTANRG